MSHYRDNDFDNLTRPRGRPQFNPFEQYAHLFPPPGSHSRNRGGRGQTRARRNYQQTRIDNKRIVEGARTTEKINDVIRATLHPGATSSEDLLAKIGETHTLKAITLSISTRAIGFGLCHLNFIAVTYNEIQIPNVYSQYRVFLAVLEAKLENLKRHYPLPARDTELVERYQVDAMLLHVAQTATIAPEPIQRVINAVGIITYDEGIYIPAVSRGQDDERGRFVPRPENILYSTLRKTVEALASPATPDRYRRRFEENNPIPGAIWENHLLTNADEIMPLNYTTDHLREDIALLSPYLSKLQKHVPKMVGGTIDFKSVGKLSSFVCNKMSGLHIPSRLPAEALDVYYRRAYPRGNIHDYSCFAKLTAADRLEGQLNLLGELPTFGNYIHPVYSIRSETICRYEYHSDYQAMAQIMYAL